ncbi:hypothetical protein Q9L58_009728, partial [Maublancomyces gigas]
DAWSTPESTFRAAAALDNQFQLGINAAVPWSKPSPKSRQWWTPEIKQLKIAMNNAQREIRTLNLEEAKKERKKAARKWRAAIRQA